MHFASALSTQTDTRKAVEEVAAAIRASLGSDPADIATLFVSHHHEDAFDGLGADVRQACRAKHLIGCSGESIIGPHREIENRPALSVWAARLPGAEIRTFAAEFEPTPEGAAFAGWPEGLDQLDVRRHAVVLLADPFSFDAEAFLERVHDDAPGLRVVGGMASGGSRPGETALFLDDQLLRQGALGITLGGALQLQCVVSQGCKPIGEHLVVTKSHQNVILELGGKPALERLAEVFATLDAREQQVFQNGPHLGRVINEYKDSFGRGDFLVRNLLGFHRETGAIAIGDLIRAGQTVQFHARDAAAADEDLRELLAGCKAGAALLFTCNGRGTRLFDRPSHDVSVLREQVGAIPVAGFFAQGEIGPVGDRNFLHGFTATVLLFQDQQ